MKRAALLLITLAGLALGGTAAGVLAAGSPPPPTTSTTTTTTTPAATIATGVSIGGVDVGGMTAVDALRALETAFDASIQIVAGGRTRILATPDVLGATAAVDKAVEKAATAAPGTKVPLAISVDGATLADFVGRIAKRYDRASVESKLFLRRGRPWVSKERAGRKLEQRRSIAAIRAVLPPSARKIVVLPYKVLKPKVTRRSYGSVIVIHRGMNRLFLYRGVRFVRVFNVATGQSAYPTPLGRFTIAVKWRNPWWYPPDSPWAKGQKPIPPGPGNPLGTRWMGLTAPGVGIHGTPDAGSIGYSVSHGCIRMRISDAEWLFNHVSIGTTVFIVPG